MDRNEKWKWWKLCYFLVEHCCSELAMLHLNWRNGTVGANWILCFPVKRWKTWHWHRAHMFRRMHCQLELSIGAINYSLQFHDGEMVSAWCFWIIGERGEQKNVEFLSAIGECSNVEQPVFSATDQIWVMPSLCQQREPNLFLHNWLMVF